LINVVVSKTPFSATISLKCSFAKRFQNSEPEKVSTESLKIRVKTEDTDVEISKFKNTIEDLEKEVARQKNALKLKHKEIKDFNKSAEDQIGILHEELLKVKREQNKLGSRIKILKDEVKLVSGESDNVKHENGDLITKVKNLQ
jgi:chromosome segregation ATPase